MGDFDDQSKDSLKRTLGEKDCVDGNCSDGNVAAVKVHGNLCVHGHLQWGVGPIPCNYGYSELNLNIDF